MPNSIKTELQGELIDIYIPIPPQRQYTIKAKVISVTDQEEKEFETAGRKEDCLLNENTAQEIL